MIEVEVVAFGYKAGGKMTRWRMLTGILTPSTGRIAIDGNVSWYVK